MLRFNLVQTEKAKYFLRTAYNIFFNDVAKIYENPDALDAANDEFKARETEKFIQAKNWYEKHFSGLDIEVLPILDLNDENFSARLFEFEKFTSPL